MTTNLLKKSVYFTSFIYLLVRSYLFLDPDFGWRLRHGQMILESGIARVDPFSYTMPTYAFVDHAYAVSATVAFLYSFFGLIGPALIFSSVMIFTLYLSYNFLRGAVLKNFITYKKSLGIDLKAIGSVAFLLVFSLLEVFFGVRAQVASWFLFVVLVGVAFDEKRWEKYKKFAPFFFLLWANIHGSFAMGIGALGIVLAARSIRLGRIYFPDWLIYFTSVSFTLINPYGIGVWREAWSSFADTGLRWSIAEWMPGVTLFNMTLPIILDLGIAVVFKYRARFLLEEVVVFVLFLALAISSRRHLPFFALVAFPLIERGISFLLTEISRIKDALKRFGIVYKYFWAGVFVLVIVQTILNFTSIVKMAEDYFYPKKAIGFLRANPPDGEIFSEYGWGGYLIWKLPEKRVFIDGRMPSWKADLRDKQSLTFVKQSLASFAGKMLRVGNRKELVSAFDTSNEILEGEVDFDEVAVDFNIDTILWPKTESKNFQLKISHELNVFLEGKGWKKEQFDFITEVERAGWRRVYEDEIAIILRK